MSARLLDVLVPLLAFACAASAAFRLARIRFPRHGAGLWALPKGPSLVLAFLESLAALFLMVPNTLVWGLSLGGMLAACHVAALWKACLSDPVQT